MLNFCYSLFDALDDAICIVDVDGRVRYWSAAAAKIYGIGSEEALGRKVPELFAIEGAGGWEEWESSHLGHFRGEVVHVVRPDSAGRVRRCSVHWIVREIELRDAATHVRVMIARDLGERDRLSDAARRHREMSDAIINGLPGMFFVVDPEFRLVRWNRNYQIVTGLRDDELPGREVLSGVLIDDRELAREGLRRVVRDGYAADEYRIVTQSGETRHFHFSGVRVQHGDELYVVGIGIDLTDRRRAEEALRETQQRFTTLAEATFEGIAVFERGTLVDANPQLADLLGYAVHELVGRAATELVALPDRERVAQAIASESREPCEHLALRRDGAVFPVEMRTRSTSFLGGQVRVSAIRDITHQRRAEQAMRESETRLRCIFEATRDAIGVTQGGRQVFGNPALLRLFGYESPDELMNRSALDLIAPCERQRVGMLAASAASGQPTPGSYETRGLRRDGTEFDMEVHASSYTIDNEEFRLVILRDISERKKAERALRQSEARLRTVVENAHGGIAMADASGTIIAWNHEEERLTGIAASEAIGRPVWEVLPPPRAPGSNAPVDIERQRSELQEFMRTGQASWAGRTVEHEYDLPQGRTVVLGRSSLIPAPDGPIFLRTTQDITERRRMEEERVRLGEQLRQAQKMESIGRLAGGVAHDFNNLLTSILGNVELARMDLDAADARSQGVEARLEEIRRAAQSAAALTRQLLAFSRKQIIEPTVVDLNTLIDQMHRMLIRVIGEDIDLRTVPGPGLGRVRVDRSQIEQIIVNLAVNARDAMPDGGQLSIETANVVLDETYCRARPEARPGPHVLLAVTDTGCGMTREVMDHIFEPFYTTKESGKGTGLGLATVYGATQQNNGIIDVYSEVGHGSCFKIYLPRVDLVADTHIAPPPQLLGGDEAIVLVEDDAFVRNVAVDILGRLGYQVRAFSGGTEALDTVEKEPCRIDLLVTDVVMPGINGKMLAERMLALRSDMRVLFTSGYTQDVIAHRGALEPGIHFISKPYSMEALASKIRSVLDATDAAAEKDVEHLQIGTVQIGAESPVRPDFDRGARGA